MMIEDYLGWRYVFYVSVGMLILWGLIIFRIQARYKKKNQKIKVQRKWWFWVVSGFIIFHMLFVQIINPSYLGYGTPEDFFKIHVSDDQIVLFDETVSYYDDDNISTDDYTGHLRVHLINRDLHTKEYSKLIGDNYSVYEENNRFFVLSNSEYYSGDNDNVVYSVSEFDLDTKEKILLAEKDEFITVAHEKVKVYEIYQSLGIFVKSDRAEVYKLNSKTNEFEFFDGEYQFPEVIESDVKFYMATSANSNDNKNLFINNVQSKHTFLLGEIVSEYSRPNESYALIKSYENLEQSFFELSLVDQLGKIVWTVDMELFERNFGTDGLSDIQLIKFYKSFCYMTLDAYLVEIELRTGNINWWLKV